ncbi:MAG: hypothetical protein H0U26_00810 [Acidimicrobiia bacterium]|nr:hypothetical protein [Acidimicrobiia bacterium]
MVEEGTGVVPTAVEGMAQAWDTMSSSADSRSAMTAKCSASASSPRGGVYGRAGPGYGPLSSVSTQARGPPWNVSSCSWARYRSLLATSTYQGTNREPTFRVDDAMTVTDDDTQICLHHETIAADGQRLDRAPTRAASS